MKSFSGFPNTQNNLNYINSIDYTVNKVSKRYPRYIWSTKKYICLCSVNCSGLLYFITPQIVLYNLLWGPQRCQNRHVCITTIMKKKRKKVAAKSRSRHYKTYRVLLTNNVSFRTKSLTNWLWMVILNWKSIGCSLIKLNIIIHIIKSYFFRLHFMFKG